MNQKPYFVSASPFYPLTVQTFIPGRMYTFSVEVGDPNPDDVLYARWVVNYPDYLGDAVTKVLIEIDSTQEGGRHPTAIFTSPQLSCTDLPKAAANSLAFIVSDRPFLTKEMGAQFDSAHPFNFDDETPTQKVLTMINWPIIGCQ